jgi:hypothetical protein
LAFCKEKTGGPQAALSNPTEPVIDLCPWQWAVLEVILQNASG